MKQVIHLFPICLFFLCACNKDNKPGFEITSFSPEKGAYNLEVTINGNNFDTLIANTKVAFNGADATIISVSKTVIRAIVPQPATTGKISVTINNQTAFSGTDFIILPGRWTQIGSLPTDKGRVLGHGFSIGNKGYLALGTRVGFDAASTDRMNDILEYNPQTNSWIEKAPLSLKLASGMGMVINNKFYVGIGETTQGFKTNQFWEYDPSINQWTRKADFPGMLRTDGIAFGLGNKGYAGTGLYNGTSALRDWWEYDPATNTWTGKTEYPGAARVFLHLLTGFVLNNKIYMGLGPSFNDTYRDWWEYDATTDKWTRKKDFPGQMKWGASGFVVDNKGYVLAAGTECWQYDPSTDQWTQKAFFAPRYMGAAFSIGNKGYYVTGCNLVGSGTSIIVNDVWEFIPQ